MNQDIVGYYVILEYRLKRAELKRAEAARIGDHFEAERQKAAAAAYCDALLGFEIGFNFPSPAERSRA